MAYSCLSALFFNRAGIDGRCVTGRLPEGGHVWNWLELAGDWYAYDSTGSSERFFIMGINTTFHTSIYSYTKGQLDYTLPVSVELYQYKAYLSDPPKGMPVLYQKEATDSGRIGSNLKWILENGLLTIKGNGEMRDLENETLVPWKNFTGNITNLEIEEGVTSIRAYAFYNVKGLTYENCTDKLDSIKIIGEKAFSDMENVLQVLKEKGLKTIDDLKFLEENAKTEIFIKYKYQMQPHKNN
ncbi:leucine-rich repeat protein [Histomonas meleagridis]|uniref:leucine-rich repeat protein n=1 Tax=Histomonas meleagridis TaxID=135588 RepID=UPI00355A1199|nr:leucine-rich repeat protein [Histomonas meleagridis]KAH0801189.1 leucine-rich repeat protein [Histomonas meleagridis]